MATCSGYRLPEPIRQATSQPAASGWIFKPDCLPPGVINLSEIYDKLNDLQQRVALAAVRL
jgi:hypothetical protein